MRTRKRYPDKQGLCMKIIVMRYAWVTGDVHRLMNWQVLNNGNSFEKDVKH